MRKSQLGLVIFKTIQSTALSCYLNLTYTYIFFISWSFESRVSWHKASDVICQNMGCTWCNHI